MNGGKSGQMALQTRPHKIRPSDGSKAVAVPLAVVWYGFHEFGGYLGNVGLTFPDSI